MTKQLLIHAGYGKTATTWLQRKIFPNISQSIYIGKDPFLSKSFERLHYKLFQPLYAIDKYSARNSAILINEYAKMIKGVVSKGLRDIKKVVISDECILDYANYGNGKHRRGRVSFICLEKVVNNLVSKLAVDY